MVLTDKDNKMENYRLIVEEARLLQLAIIWDKQTNEQINVPISCLALANKCHLQKHAHAQTKLVKKLNESGTRNNFLPD